MTAAGFRSTVKCRPYFCSVYSTFDRRHAHTTAVIKFPTMFFHRPIPYTGAPYSAENNDNEQLGCVNYQTHLVIFERIYVRFRILCFSFWHRFSCFFFTQENRRLKFWFTKCTQQFARLDESYAFFRELINPDAFPRGRSQLSFCMTFYIIFLNSWRLLFIDSCRCRTV